MKEQESQRPFEGGAQPVREHPPEMPGGGRSIGQVIVFALVLLVLLAAILWILVPMGS